MDQNQRNKRKRKNADLTTQEWLQFFFFPSSLGSNFFPTKGHNDHEFERFKKFGFDKKQKQARYAQICGFVFYFMVFVIVVKLIDTYLIV